MGVAACANPPAPIETIEFVPDSRTADGLYRMADTAYYAVYLKPGTRLGDYTKMIVDPFMVSYKRRASAERRGRQPAKALTLEADEEASLVAALQEAFVDEMARSRTLQVGDEPGRDVLRMQGRITDLVVEPSIPRDSFGPRELHFGEMMLILDVRDSETAEPLARVANRFVSDGEASVKIDGYLEQRQLVHEVRRWAKPLREGLDELHALPPAPPAPGQ
jgi:hypothetical protein